MKKSEYQQTIDRVLKPGLLALGFVEVKLKDCIKPEVIYRSDSLWFGTSWDWRDRYLEIGLGRLHWFKDAMPRFIVLGDYSSYSNEIDKLNEADENYLENIANTLVTTIEPAINTYNEKYEKIVAGFLENRNKCSVVFKDHLGSEVRDEELSKYMA